MLTLDDLLQQIREIPQSVREPHLSDKEIDQITNNLLATCRYDHLCRMQIK